MSGRWISGEELTRLKGCDIRTIQRLARSGEIESRPRPSLRGGRPTREYLIGDFTASKLDQQRAADIASGVVFSKDRVLMPGSYNEPGRQICTEELPALGNKGKLPKVALSDEEEAQARERYRTIEPLIKLEAEHRSAAKGQLHLDLDFRLPDGTPVTNRSQLCLYLAGKYETSEATIWRWVRLFRDGGLPALADQVRSDKGQSRFFKQYPQAATLAAYVYLEQRQSMRAAHEAILRDAESLCIKREELPSYSTVYAFLNGNTLSKPMKLLAREGRRAYRERCAPYVSRGYTDVAANEIWVSDHMIHDVSAQNDCFHDAPMGTPIRLRFTCLLDFRSRYVVGESWAWEGSSRSIGTALRRAVTKHGPAGMMYCDNGKDYLKVAKGAMPGYLRSELEPAAWFAQEMRGIEELGVLARLGMGVQHCIVRHPQSKHVERFFGTLHERFDKKFPTYTGGSPDRRPEFTADAMAAHGKLLRMGQANRSKLPAASMVMAMCMAWIEEYHQRPHSGKGMNGRTPAQVFAEEQSEATRATPQPKDLALLLLERERRWVRECSIVLSKRRYIGSDEIGQRILHDLNEREVIVAYDPLDLEMAAILDLDGHLLTFAKTEKFLTQSSAANEAISESMAERRQMEKVTASTILGIRDAARANGAVSEVEHLARRAQVLPIAVGDVREFMTQRKVHMRPNENATAPPSAADIARGLMTEDDE